MVYILLQFLIHNFDNVKESYKSRSATESAIILPSHHTTVVGTGISLSIPYGYELQVRSRSGNSLNKGYVVANSPGTIDSNYRGEIGVIIHNNSPESIILKLGDKVAQGVLCEVPIANFIPVKVLDNNTTRNTSGFGSTDKK